MPSTLYPHPERSRRSRRRLQRLLTVRGRRDGTAALWSAVVVSRQILKHQREDLARVAHAAQDVAPERLEAGAATLGRRGEGGRDEDLAIEGLAQRLDARHLVDGGADDGEVDAVGGADIAVEHLAEMEREIDGGDRLAGGRARSGERVERLHRLGGGIEGGAAGPDPVRPLPSEGGEHGGP